ncbi:NUDIX domain-containing protein [Streptomyces sp. 110]|uniref:NUDIX domain-containing protein n=1 Tax=Streptomyces endocoffeicus TaxID=2898945 RepID=A0ABS1PS52_9ACTN|nr:NUDIX domain-containing protein [Streptomyces endocoffeicus]MBL1115264.1 NUDIX domain-containing protein [Streptomyces endocoffeicus]
MPKTCDRKCAGTLIPHPEHPDWFLMFERNTPPVGLAFPTGHIDTHGSPVETARIEPQEEVGVDPTGLREVLSLWLPNRCRRQPGPAPYGHQWTVFQADGFTGDPKESDREAKNMRWVNQEMFATHTRRTTHHAYGDVSAEDFAECPGLEPAWCRLLHEMGMLALTQQELEAVESLYVQAP